MILHTHKHTTTTTTITTIENQTSAIKVYIEACAKN